MTHKPYNIYIKYKKRAKNENSCIQNIFCCYYYYYILFLLLLLLYVNKIEYMSVYLQGYCSQGPLNCHATPFNEQGGCPQMDQRVFLMIRVCLCKLIGTHVYIVEGVSPQLDWHVSAEMRVCLHKSIWHVQSTPPRD